MPKKLVVDPLRVEKAGGTAGKVWGSRRPPTAVAIEDMFPVEVGHQRVCMGEFWKAYLLRIRAQETDACQRGEQMPTAVLFAIEPDYYNWWPDVAG